jgi:predicted aldo/keto reductase-like oxidoreductase
MKQNLDEGLKECGLDYVDVWRITVREHTTFHTVQEIENIMEALEWGKKTGRARATGISTHHRPWLAKAVAKYPQLEVIVTPYAAGTKQKPVGSMFDSFKKHNVGLVGIKPFASGSLFLSRGVPDSPTKAEDDERARMALRYVLSYDGLTCAIPGLITVDQVKNAAAAVKERREFDVAEARRYKEIADNMWRNLPPSYEWLRDWEYV